MQLAKHLAQGRLVYLSQFEDAIIVSENDYYRWMAFSDVVQSVMNKRRPSKLTLPHQITLMLPLLFYRPKRILELGLGGGNITRFLTQLSPEISLTTVEHSQQVIDTFHEFFNPEKESLNIILADGMSWLAQHNTNNIDWIICDVYQSKALGFNIIVQQLDMLTSKLDDLACLSINLPDISDSDVNLCLTILQQLRPEHCITHFTIPNYLNIVIHLTPKIWPLHRLIKRNKRSYLSMVRLHRWQKFWRYGQQLP